MQKIVFITVLLFSFLPVFSQGSIEDLSRRIGNERNFKRIEEIAAVYFKEVKEEEPQAVRRADVDGRDGEEDEEFENAAVFFNRWAWYNGSRLDDRGNVTDYNTRNIKAINTLGAVGMETLTNNSTWSKQGPNSYTVPATQFANGTVRNIIDGLGRVDCLAFHPTDANVIYAGTAMAGLWKTTNGGNSWNQVAGLFPFLGIAGVVVNKNNGNEIWALAGSAENRNTWGIFASGGGCRVYHSIDAGINWQARADLPGIGGNKGHDLLQHPSSQNTLFVATQAGVYSTFNGGTTWDITTLTQGVYDMEINPTSGRLYATGPGFVKYSSNLGSTWNDCTFDIPITDMNRASIAISPTGFNSIVYLLCGPGGNGSFYGMYRSNNSGVIFTRQSNSPNVFDYSTDGSGDYDQSTYDNCIVAHPSDASKILVGGAAIWQSINDGATMTFNTYYWHDGPANRYVHPDIHTIKVNPLNNYTYAGTDGGVYVSTDFGATWAQKSNGLSAAQVFHLSIYKNNETMELIGSQDNGVKIRRNSGAYEQFEGADGYCGQFSLNDSSILYATYNAEFSKYQNFGQKVINTAYPFLRGGDEKFYTLIKVIPSATSTEILFAAALDTLSRSTDGAASWTRIVRKANWDIQYAPGNSAYLYVAGGNNFSAPAGFSLSRNSTYGTGTWTNITGTLGTFGQRAMKFAINPNNSLHIFVCLGGYTNGQKVYESVNGGDTWATNVSYNLANVPVNAIAIDGRGHLYAGTDIGVYVLPAGQTQWRQFYNGLPRVPVSDLIINESSATIKASTFGCGVYKSDLYGGCPAVLNFIVDVSGRKTFEASDQINGLLFTTSGGYDFTDIKLKAGNKIIFSPGSIIKDGTVIAGIGPCGSDFPLRVIPVNPVDSIAVPAKNNRKDEMLPNQLPVKSMPVKKAEPLLNKTGQNSDKKLRRKGTGDGEQKSLEVISSTKRSTVH